MKTYTLLAVGVALALLSAPGMVATTPTQDGVRTDTSGMEGTTYTTYVPAGHALVATVTAEGVVLSSTPVLAVPVTDSGFGSCIYTTGGVGWIANGLNLCPGPAPTLHQAPLSSVTLITTGTATADAWNYLPFFATWFIQCTAPGNLGGSGSCTEFGSFSGFSYYDALTSANAASVILYQ